MGRFAYLALFLCALDAVSAFPGYRRATAEGSLNSTNCFPYGRPVRPAEPFDPRFPYLGAKHDGQPGNGKGGILVPAPGDKAHRYQKPEPGAYRGVCPGLNAPANYGFLSRDGVATFNELVAMQQNVFNFGFDASTVLAAAGIGLDGDVETETVSIGGNQECLGLQGGGLNTGDFFEGDVSLTRNDYLLRPDHDNYSFNGTLWKFMVDTMKKTSSKSNPIFDRAGISLYKHLRWELSKAENGQFHFGANTLIFYTAATALYGLLAGDGPADVKNIGTFFGVKKNSSAPGGFSSTFADERIPWGWRNRKEPLTLYNLFNEIHVYYTEHYKLLGHNEGLGNYIVDERQWDPKGTTKDLICFLYDSFTGRGLSQPSPLPPARLKYIVTHINPHFGAQGCELLHL